MFCLAEFGYSKKIVFKTTAQFNLISVNSKIFAEQKCSVIPPSNNKWCNDKQANVFSDLPFPIRFFVNSDPGTVPVLLVSSVFSLLFRFSVDLSALCSSLRLLK